MSFSINGIPIIENIGTVGLYSGATDPSGWIICDGQPRINTTGTYNNLFLQTTGKNYGYGPTWTNYGISSTINTPAGSITLVDVRGVAVSNVGTVVLADRASTGLYISQNNGATYSTLPVSGTTTAGPYTPNTSSSNIPNTATVAPYSNTWTASGLTWIATGSNWNSSANFVPSTAFASSGGVYAGWCPGNKYTTGGNLLYTVSNGASTSVGGGIGTVLGEWLQLQSSTVISLTNFQIACERGTSTVGNSPGTFYLLGSNTGTGTWDPIMLCTLTSAAYSNTVTPYFTSLGGTTYCTPQFSVPSGTTVNTVTGNLTYTTYGNSANSYQYFRMVTTTIASAGNGFLVILLNLNFNINTPFGNCPVSCVDISQDGTKIVAAANVVGQGLFVSTNTGSTWSQLYTQNGLPSDLISMDNGSNKVAISNDGTKISVAYTNGFTYFSSNSGNNFQIVSPEGATGTSVAVKNVSKNYWGLGMSKDGTKLVTAVNNGSFIPDFTKISFVTNPGTGLPASNTYKKTALSATGQYGLASVDGGNVYFTNNYGQNWSIPSVFSVASSWRGVSISSTGQYMIVALWGGTGAIYLSTNYGIIWSSSAGNSVTHYYTGASISSTGQYMATISNDGPVTFSSSYGVFWKDTPGTGLPTVFGYPPYIAISATGQYIITSQSNNQSPYRSTNFGVNWSIVSSIGGVGGGSQNDVAMSGSGQYMVVGGSGNSYVSSSYGSFFTTFAWSASQSSVSYTGQIIIMGSYISTNYGVNFTVASYISTAVAMSADGQYILTGGTTLNLAKFPYWANGQNNVAKYWTKGPGGLTTGAFSTVNTSYDGKYIIAAITSGAAYLSIDYGQSWTARPGSGLPATAAYYWSSVSTTGQYIGLSGSNFLYLSSNFGANWTLNPGSVPTGQIECIVMSGNGQYMLLSAHAQSTPLFLYLSTNFGNSWRDLTTSPSLTSITVSKFYHPAMSQSGQYMAIGTNGQLGNIRLSTNYGINWAPVSDIFTGWSFGTVMSGNGQYMYGWRGAIWSSSDFGNTWPVSRQPGYNGLESESTAGPRYSISYTGQYVIITTTVGYIYSSDYGVNWTSTIGTGLPTTMGTACSISPNGNYMLYTTGSNMYMSTYKDQPWLQQQNQVGQNFIANPGGLSSALNWRGSGVSANGQYILTISNTTCYVSSTYGNSFYSASISNRYNCSVSYSGQYMIAGPYSANTPYFSSTYGQTWYAPVIFTNNGYCTRISGNGQYALVGTGSAGGTTGSLYLSTDSGKNWMTNPGTGLPASAIYVGVGVSSNGQYMFANNYISTNYGNNWTSPATMPSIGGAACGNMSGNGKVIILSTEGANIVSFSTNYGSSFINLSQATAYPDLGISHTGQYIINGNLLSKDYGKSWTTILAGQQGSSISMNGNYMLTCVYSGSQYLSVTPNVDGGIAYSTDSGNNWINGGQIAGPYYNSVAISGDGSTMLAGYQNDSPLVSVGTSNVFNYTEIPSVPSTNTTGLALSSTGQYSMITQQNGSIYTTTSFGSNFTAATANGSAIVDNFFGAASVSASGSVMIAGAGGLAYSTTTATNSGVISFSTGSGSTIANPAVTNIDIRGLATSNTGTILYADRYQPGLFLSINSGISWSQPSGLPSIPFSCVDISQDGTQMLASANVVGYGLYLSSNSGSSWRQLYTANGLPTDLIANDFGSNKIAISNDGTKISVAYTNGFTYFSSNSGATFQNVSPPAAAGNTQGGLQVAKNYWGLGMSKDGSKLVTAVNNGSYVPNIANLVWKQTPGTGLPANAGFWNTSFSYSGQYILVNGGSTYVSSNYGNNFFTTSGTSTTGQYLGGAVSATGQYMYSGIYGGSAYISTSYGQIWSTNPGGLTTPYSYASGAISATGQYFIIGNRDGGKPYFSSNFGNNFNKLTSLADDTYYGAAISATGQYIMVSSSGNTQISSNYGANWTLNPTGASGGFFVSMSGTGQYMLIAKEESNYNILISSNYGSSFSTTGQTTPGLWTATFVSYTGQFMMACPGSGTAGTLRMSSSYGVNWTANPGSGLPGTGQYRGIGMSANAQYMIAGGNTGSVYLASNPYWTGTGATFNTTNWIQNQGAGQNWTKNPGGLPASSYYYTQSISNSGQYVIIINLSSFTINALYITTNYGRTFTKSPNPWGASTNYGWGFSAISSTGQYSLVTTNYGYLYMSTNYCASYFSTLTVSGGSYVSISGNAQFMLYTNNTNTYISTNYGTNWSSSYGSTFPQALYTVGISYTGQYMIGNNTTTNILYRSANYGLTWYQSPINANSMYVNVSYTGQYMTYGQSPGTSYISSDYGISFNSTPYRTYNISMSASAQYMTIAEYAAAQSVYLSTNYGKNWTAKISGLEALVYSVISGNGEYIYACGVANNNIDGYVYQSTIANLDNGLAYSTDSGNNWTPGLNASGAYLNSVAISADGSTMLANYQGTQPFLSVGASNAFFQVAMTPSGTTYGMSFSGTLQCGMSLSNTGQYAVITQNNGQIYYTSNTGATFQTSSVTTADNFYGGAYVSGNGQYIVASAGSNLYTSLTSGTSFTKTVQVPQLNGITYVTYTSTGSTSQNWNDAAISSNGQYMLAASTSAGGGFLYLSTNSGAFWSAPLGTGVAYQLAWNGCAVSPTTNSSGYYVMAATVNGGNVYLSVNSGVTWLSLSSTLPNAAWSSISMDTDGSIMAVIASGSQIYVSSNTGSTFLPYGSALAYTDIAVSLTGQYMAATVSGGQIYVSTSFGTTWTPYATTQTWLDIHMSGAANIMVAAVSNGPLYISTNTGQAWTTISASNNVLPSSANWGNVGISSEGTYLVATISGGAIYTSTNGGAFWSNIQTTVTGTSSGASWSNCLAMSGNGSTIIAGQSNTSGGSGLLYVSINTLFTKTINTSTWQTNNIPATISVQSGTVTLVDVRGIATSDVGTMVMADRGSTGLYISQNNGTTWSVVSGSGLPAISFSCVDISADGSDIIAAANVVGYGLYLSTNGGSNWTQLYTANGLPTDLISMDNGSNKVAISNDGTKISVAYTNGFVYYSSNSGSSFKAVSPISTAPGSTSSIPKNYWGLGMSKDGTKLVTAVNNGSLVPNYSNLSGLFVTSPGTGLAATTLYGHSSMSYNGQYQAIGVTASGVYVSSNYGSNWRFTSGYCTGGGVGNSITAMSATGQYIYGMVGGATGTFCYSSNYGVNWVNTATAIASYGSRQISCSATGQYVLVSIDAQGATPCLLSSTYGTSFISIASVPNNRYGGGAVSSTGQYMVIVGIQANGYSSSNYGVNWTVVTHTSIAGGGGRIYASGSGQYFVMFGWLGQVPYISSTYGTSFFASSGTSTGDVYGGISYSGQYMVSSNQYSSNYGVNWTTITNMVVPCISANGEYVLAITAGGGSVKLAKLPYWANGQNYVGQYWTKNPGTGLPSSDTYHCVATSYTGQYVLTVGGTNNVYLSSNHGNNWTVNTSLTLGGSAGAVCCVSYTGKYMLLAGQTNAYTSSSQTNAYTSSSYGANWKLAFNTISTNSGGPRGGAVSSLPLSDEGKYMLVTVNAISGAQLSSNYGASWRQITSAPLNGSAMSATGQYIIYGCYDGPWKITMSTDYGINFSTSYSPASGATYNFMGFSMSGTGQYMLSVTYQGGAFFVSSTYGVSWTQVSSSIISNVKNYWGASVSVSGQYMMGGGDSIDVLYFSTNYGVWWINIFSATYGLTDSGRFAPICISANAQYAYVSNGSTLYGSTYNYSFWLQQNQVGQNWTTSSATGNSGGCAMSANGQYMLTDSKYISTDYGNNFKLMTDTNISSLSGYSCAMSYSGQYMIIGANNGAPYISTNYGVNWYTNSTFSTATYRLVAVSGNGQYMLCGTCVASGVTIYMSSNFGNNWITNPGGVASTAWSQVGGISYTGQYMFVTGYLSTNYGVNWTKNTNLDGTANGSSGNVSGNGQVIFYSGYAWQAGSSKISTDYGKTFFTISFAVSGYNTMGISYTGQYLFSWGYLSTNYGVNWTLYSNINPGGNTATVNGAAMSADGNYVLNVTTGGYYLSRPNNVDGGIAYSTDSGNNWTNGRNIDGPNYNSVTISADGSTVLAGTQTGFPAISTNTTNSFSVIHSILPPLSTYGMSLSSTGQNAIITQQNGPIYTSTSYGSNFTNALVSGQSISDQFYGAASISQNGLVANAAANGTIYTSTTINASGQVTFSTGAGSTFNANNQNFSTQSGTSYITYGSQSITTQAWSSVSISSNGQVMAACSSNIAGGYVFLSTNTGSYWSANTTLSSSQLNFSSVAVSSTTGQYILASVTSGNLYVSANTGTSWTTISSVPVQPWTNVFVSSSGQVMVAVGTAIQPYVSINNGVTWSTYGSAQNYSAVTTSTTGQYMAATTTGGQIYLSTNTGTNWAVLSNSTTANWTGITMSSTGQFIVASTNGPANAQVNAQALYITSNLGLTWTSLNNISALPNNGSWSGVSMSTDGLRIVASTNTGYIYTSINGATTWTISTSTADAPRAWQFVAISGDGSKAIAITNPGQVYTSTDGQALTFTPITMPTTTTLDGTTLRYITKI